MSGVDLFGDDGDDHNDQRVLNGSAAGQNVTELLSGGALGGVAPPAPEDAAEDRLDALVERERDRQERARIAGIQDELRTQTAQRARGFGLRALLSGTLGRLSSLGSG